MKKQIICAWIEQILVFDDVEELESYLSKQEEKVKAKKQEPIQIVHKMKMGDGSYNLRIRKPYNQNHMPEQKGDYINEVR